MPRHFVVYNKGGHLELMSTCGKISMLKATSEVKALHNYSGSVKAVGLK